LIFSARPIGRFFNYYMESSMTILMGAQRARGFHIFYILFRTT